MHPVVEKQYKCDYQKIKKIIEEEGKLSFMLPNLQEIPIFPELSQIFEKEYLLLNIVNSYSGDIPLPTQKNGNSLKPELRPKNLHFYFWIDQPAKITIDTLFNIIIVWLWKRKNLSEQVFNQIKNNMDVISWFIRDEVKDEKKVKGGDGVKIIGKLLKKIFKQEEKEILV